MLKGFVLGLGIALALTSKVQALSLALKVAAWPWPSDFCIDYMTSFDCSDNVYGGSQSCCVRVQQLQSLKYVTRRCGNLPIRSA